MLPGPSDCPDPGASLHVHQPNVDDTVLAIAQASAWRACLGQP
jgi:hypothetical protein